MTKETLILFKSIGIKEHLKKIPADQKGRIKTSNKRTIPLGYILAPEVIATNDDLTKIYDLVEEHLIIKGSQMNASFHKSWKKVATASDAQLFIEQIIHYMTTYGLESLGFEYDSDNVYIPHEKLKIPALKENIQLVYIKGITKTELKDRVMKLLASGVALKQDTMDMLYTILDEIGFTESDINLVKNKEIKMAMYQRFNIIPSDPVEFLRYAVYEVTETTLLIKSPGLIAQIKEKLAEGKNRRIANLFKDYDKKFGFKKLSQIFLRFKPLFLAFRADQKLKPITNELRRLATNNHKPMPEDYLNTITARINAGNGINWDVLDKELDRVNAFRKIRLLYSLHYRKNEDHDSIVYKVRNGKAYATSRTEPVDSMMFEKVEKAVRKSIVTQLKEKLKDKKVLVSKAVQYALPATEKQFTGNLPSGTKVHVPRNMIFGVHWEDVGTNRVDLDLSLTSISGEKYGWDARMRDEKSRILFSGDMTMAPKPHGASELFFVNKLAKGTYMLAVNYFNYDESRPVPIKILVGQDDSFEGFEKGRGIESNNGYGWGRPTKPYMVDPNKIVATSNSVMDKQQKILGSLTVDENGCTFVFSEMDMGNKRTMFSDQEYVKQTQKYMYDFYNDSVQMKELLEDAGAKIITDKKSLKDKEEFIDLSIENIQKDSVLSLLI